MHTSGKVQTNLTFQGLKRTFYPKHVSYFGDGTGRDQQIIMANGGLNRLDKVGMGHHGVQFAKYNSNAVRRTSPSPSKEASTFYYQSDGSGRDSYVLKHNGGLRPEYNVRASGDRIFKDSLRSDQRSPLKHFTDPIADRGNFETYQNWKSVTGRAHHAKQTKMQHDLMKRLTTGSPNREHTINYVLGTGEAGHSERISVPSFQGYKTTYKGFLNGGAQQNQSEQLQQVSQTAAKPDKDNTFSQYANHIYFNKIKDPRSQVPVKMSHRINEKLANRGQVDISQLKNTISKIRERQAHSVMRQPGQQLKVNSSLLKGVYGTSPQRDEQIKTSWQQKRGGLSAMIDKPDFQDGKSTAGNELQTMGSEMTRTFHGRRVTLNPSNLDNNKFNTVLDFGVKEQGSKQRKLDPIEHRKTSTSISFVKDKRKSTGQINKQNIHSSMIAMKEKLNGKSRQNQNFTTADHNPFSSED